MSERSTANIERVGFGLLFYLIIISCFFFVVRPTLLFLSCYAFAVVGGIEFAVSLMIIAEKKSKLPQDWVFPIIAKSYMISNLLTSIILVFLEFKFGIEIRLIWVFLIHTTLISIFSWQILALHAGKEHMEDVNKRANSNVEFCRQQNATLVSTKAKVNISAMSLADKNVAMRKIQKVIDAIRYSDPMTPEELLSLDNMISEKINSLIPALRNNSVTELESVCDELIVNIKNRNEQIKALKNR